MHKVDDMDMKILELIRNDARMSYSEIGEIIGISRVAVRKRINQLEECNVIKEYRTIIGNSNGEDLKFFLDLVIDLDKSNSIIQALNQLSMIQEIYTAMGEYQIRCIGYAPSKEEMQNCIQEFFEKTDGIIKGYCNAVLQDVKSGGVKNAREYDERKGSADN